MRIEPRRSAARAERKMTRSQKEETRPRAVETTGKPREDEICGFVCVLGEHGSDQSIRNKDDARDNSGRREQIQTLRKPMRIQYSVV